MDSHRRFAYLRRLAAIIEANAANLKSPTSMKYAGGGRGVEREQAHPRNDSRTEGRRHESHLMIGLLADNAATDTPERKRVA